MCDPVRLFIIDDNFRDIISLVGLHYPAKAPEPANGCVVEVQGGGLVFLGFDGEQWEIVVGACPTARDTWYVRHIRDYWEQDLYLREIEDLGWQCLREPVPDPMTGISGCGFSEFLAGETSDGYFLIDLVYEHDVHDHSYQPALATATVCCAVDLETGVATCKRSFELGPPILSREELLNKMMPGDYEPIGKTILEGLCSHVTSQGAEEPMVFPCMRRIRAD